MKNSFEQPKEQLLIPRQEEYDLIVQKLIEGGPDKLHIVTDFDRTLTPHRIKGEKTTTSFAQFRNIPDLGKSYIEEAQRLFNEYHPIEIDDAISLEEKKAAMSEWWQEHMQLLVGAGMSMQVIDRVIDLDRLKLREGSREFFQKMHEAKIPVLIFSAGVGSLIKRFLERNNLMTDNVHIVSNMFTFDETGKATGFDDHVIHVFNKDESEIANEAYAGQIDARDNVILMGDSLGDLGMTEGMKHALRLSIGFLNENGEEKKKLYTAQFDAVLEGDGSLEQVNSLLGKIVKQG